MKRNHPTQSGARCTAAFMAALDTAEIKAIVNGYAAAASGLDAAEIAYERTLHCAIRDAIGRLPRCPIERAQFDALPICRVSDEAALAKNDPGARSVVGRYRLQLRSFWLVMDVYPDRAILSKPEFFEESAPLH
jgi:hypothetical protein